MIHLKSYLIIVAHFKIDIYFIKHKSLKNITISSMLTYTDIIPFITDSSDKHFFLSTLSCYTLFQAWLPSS